MLKVGFISSWHVHTADYARELRESNKGSIVAMWDEDAERGKAWAEEYGCEFVADYDAFLARTDFEAVICNSPTTMHPELLSKAAAAGKHIFTEKLLATNSKEGRALADAIEKSGVIFTVSLPLRSQPQMLYAKKLVQEGALGKISGARMRRSHSGVSDNWLPERWYDVSKSGGGAMMDLGAHPVYMLSFLFGSPKRVSGFTSNLYGTSSDENAIAMVEFDGGIIGTCETAFVTYGVPDILEVYGTDGSVFIHGDSTRLAARTKDGCVTREIPKSELPAASPSPLMQFVDACLNKGTTPQYFSAEDAMVMTQIIEACYASDKEQKTIVF